MKILHAMDREKQTAVKLFAAGLIVLLFGLFLWYRFVFASAQRTFWGMVDANLQTAGVTRFVEQKSEISKVEQFVQLQNGAQTIARGRTTIEQQNQDGETTKIISETIGTSDADYARYQTIDTPGEANFSDLVGVWGREDANAESQTQSILSEAAYGAVPFARLSPKQRSEIVKFLKQNEVYKTDFATAEKTEDEGKQVFKYKVEINTQKYIEMLKMVDKFSGLNQLSLIDPSSYANAPPIPMELTVGIDSRQLLRAKFGAVDREERFSGYGISTQIEVPSETIPRSELEEKLRRVLSSQ